MFNRMYTSMWIITQFYHGITVEVVEVVACTPIESSSSSRIAAVVVRILWRSLPRLEDPLLVLRQLQTRQLLFEDGQLSHIV